MNRQGTTPENIFSDINYDHYIVQYQGEIDEEFLKKSGYYITIINDKYAILTLQKNMKINLDDLIHASIVYVKSVEVYTLQEISPIEASQARALQLDLPLKLTGKGVIVGIIDSGIDYLNEEFMTSSGETRIENIWDQTINSTEKDEINKMPFGTVYTKSKIQEAIAAYKKGESPYAIVPSKDEIGHGTKMAGIIGATGKNSDLKGVVPDCEFAVVKLIEDFSYESQFDIKVPVFNITSIFAAIEFLHQYAIMTSKPMVIYLPLGTNSGNHKGDGILEEYIESISINRGIVVVTGSGNERARGSHTSGIIPEVGGTSTIELDVSTEQKYLWAEVWVDVPNIMTLNIVSPSGEDTGIIPAVINSIEYYTFIFEKTSITVNFYLPEENTGDELIRISFYNVQPGIWKITLIANSVLDGKYNVWIPQQGITIGETHLSPSDPYGTITNPGTSRSIITVAAYNQNNNNLVNYSGMAFANDYIDVIDIAAGGVNALTVAPNNQIATVNGTSVSATIVVGTCAMLLEWGIIDGNDPYMYSQTIKTYLVRGTTKRVGDIYPNPQWGYGILNVLGIFQNMR
ncbi:S8 family peptidase [Clostridium uliginosum]|uniref:Subtilase family protein n=1 Tax=Clostridium uliginosum TaxID=119641 RepID=A0A1I1RGE9_9CLOT|nr:S8 family peptidase [Clostridium uliginosum]SFD31248.1 Subtilase family protein [Clostridium uliginosum]